MNYICQFLEKLEYKLNMNFIMKKLIFTLAIGLGVFSSAVAQDAKMWVGGTVGLWSSKTKGADSELSFKVMPEFGYIVNDNLAVGISLGAAHTHAATVAGETLAPSLNFDGSSSISGSANIYKIKPFARYSFLKGTLGALFVDGGVGYERVVYNGQNIKGYGLEAGFRPGFALNVSSKLALISKIGFLGYQYAKAGDAKVNSFGFDLDMDNVEFGVSYKF